MDKTTIDYIEKVCFFLLIYFHPLFAMYLLKVDTCKMTERVYIELQEQVPW